MVKPVSDHRGIDILQFIHPLGEFVRNWDIFSIYLDFFGMQCLSQFTRYHGKIT